jgi:two-component system, cell cycle response regulator DivK
MAHILIVEDYRDNRNVVEFILRYAGYTVTSADNGLHGIQLAARVQPDLILMDLALPWLNGWEATRHLKANPTTRYIPVVAFTAHITPEDMDHALAAGCVAIIAKPFEIDVFLTKIVALLAQTAEHGRERAIGADWQE